MKSSLAAFLIVATASLALGQPAAESPTPAVPTAPAAPVVTTMPAKSEMTALQAIVLGVVEGVTEYLPVSSTAHLILTEKIMGIGAGSEESKEAADAYAIVIQGGAILAVLLLYFGRIQGMARGVIGRDEAGRKLAINTIVAFLPAALVGLLIHKQIKLYLFGMWPIVFAWFVGGMAILLVAWSNAGRRSRSGLPIGSITTKMALGIGLAQCIAMWPGTSRSLITIVGGVIAGLSLSAAVEFSFILGLITLSAATLLDTKQHGSQMLHLFGPLSLIAGFIAALVSAVLAIEWLVGYLKKHGMQLFGYYRVLIAAGVALLLLLKVLQP
jgi:undecaprenyl-diphosphatase